MASHPEWTSHPDHFYLKMVANVAAGDKPGEAVPDADDAEYDTQVKLERVG
jgi:tetrathionate reductase subunit A